MRNYTFRPPPRQPVQGGLLLPVLGGGLPPAAPDAAAPIVIGSIVFEAKWGVSVGATSYRLDVSTDPAFGSFLAGYNDLDVGAVLKKRVTSLTANTTYYYRVRAVNAGGTSSNSNVITVLTLTGFHPHDIAGMIFMHQADSLTLSNNDPVGTWADLSDNGRDWSQGTSAAKPTFKTPIMNGKPVVRFDGVDDYMDMASNPTLGSVFMVTQLSALMTDFEAMLTAQADTGSNDIIFTRSGASWASNTIDAWYKDGVSGNSVDNTVGVPHIYGGTRSTPAALSGNWRMGVDRNNGGVGHRWWTGDIPEVIGYDTVLSTTDRQAVENYLTNKYFPATGATAGYTRARASAYASVSVTQNPLARTRALSSAWSTQTISAQISVRAQSKTLALSTGQAVSASAGYTRALASGRAVGQAGRLSAAHSSGRASTKVTPSVSQTYQARSVSRTTAQTIITSAKAAAARTGSSGQGRSTQTLQALPTMVSKSSAQGRVGVSIIVVPTAYTRSRGIARSIADTTASTISTTDGFTRSKSTGSALASAAQRPVSTTWGRASGRSTDIASRTVAAHTKTGTRIHATPVSVAISTARSSGRVGTKVVPTIGHQVAGSTFGRAVARAVLSAMRLVAASTKAKGNSYAHNAVGTTARGHTWSKVQARSDATTLTLTYASTGGFTWGRVRSYAGTSSVQSPAAYTASRAKGQVLGGAIQRPSASATAHGSAYSVTNTAQSPLGHVRSRTVGWSVQTHSLVVAAGTLQGRSRSKAHGISVSDWVVSSYARSRVISHAAYYEPSTYTPSANIYVVQPQMRTYTVNPTSREYNVEGQIRVYEPQTQGREYEPQEQQRVFVGLDIRD